MAIVAEPHQTVQNVLADAALRDWVASQHVEIALLGIRVSVDDAPVLGTATLFVLSLWLILLMRRENHTIGFLLRDTDTARSDRHLSYDESETQEHYRNASGIDGRTSSRTHSPQMGRSWVSATHFSGRR